MTAIVFPGQGSQYLGMTKDFYDNFEVAKNTFEEIEDYLQINLKKVIFSNENDKLNLTKYTQVSIFTSSMIIFRTLISESNLDLSSISVMMGHSLGEYTALACSEKISIKDCSTLLKERSQLMNDTVSPNTTGMAALIGVDSKKVQSLIDDNKIDLEIANDNSPIQVVVSGHIEQIINSKDFFLKNNVKKYIILKVSAAFHSKFMISAQNELSARIENTNFKYTSINLISNYNANISNDSIEIKNALKKQMANKVKWTDSVKKLEQSGENKIIEIGPNNVLSSLIKRISSNFDIKSINKIEDMN